MYDTSKTAISIYIKQAAHHLDLREPNPKDPQEVQDARDMERAAILKWVKEYNDIVTPPPI